MCPPVSAETESAEDGHSLMAPPDELTRDVRRILAAKGVRPSDVDDEAQNAILKLLDKTCPVGGQPLIEVYECEQACSCCRGKALVCCVVQRKGIDRIRKYSRDCEVQFPEDPPEIPERDDDDGLFELVDETDYPLHVKRLHTAISKRLTDDERRAVWMKFRDRLSIRKIAAELNVSDGTAWNILQRRAIPKLRAAFGERGRRAR